MTPAAATLQSRRHALRLLALACGVAWLPALAGESAEQTGPAQPLLPADQAWNALAFAATAQADALRALGLQGPLQGGEGGEVGLQAPELAENGAVVPVRVQSRLVGVRRVLLMAPRNPNLLVADFRLVQQVGADLSTRIKLAETGPVLALVQAQSGLYIAEREVKVTIGGCGG